MHAPHSLVCATAARGVVCALLVQAVLASDAGAAGITLQAGLADFSSALPVVVIDNSAAGEPERGTADQPAQLAIFAPRSGETRLSSAESLSAITFSVRGASSADFPKKSFNITLRNEGGSKQAQPLLELPAAEKWALVGPWSFDQGYINNAFVYALSNRIGRWAPRTRFVELFLNTDGGEVTAADYHGVYVLTERIEPGAARVAITALGKGDRSAAAITGGYILKIDRPTEEDIGWHTRSLPEGTEFAVVLVTPRAEDVTPAQENYIREYVRQMEDALHADAAANWSQRTSSDYIDRPAWVDHHLLNTLVCNPDALNRSAYFAKDRNGKLAAGPVWDFDRALGSYNDERSYRWDVWSGIGGSDVWRVSWWGLLARDPEFVQDWIDRWQTLRRGALSTEQLVGLARELAAQIGSAAAGRDAARWSANASPYGGYAAQIDWVSGWLSRRAQWIDEQFVAAPEVRTEGDRRVFVAPAGATLVYTLDGSDPRLLGGEIAPNARLTTEPLIVPADANVHVRAYRAVSGDAFPRSPWSSVRELEGSSAMSPRARIANLSTQAVVRAADAPLVIGVAVADTLAKRVVARAVGPGLRAFGANDVLRSPEIAWFRGDGREVARNRGWESSSEAAIMPQSFQSVGAFPLARGSADAALIQTIAANAHTLQISTTDGTDGAVLAEFYELDRNGRTTNLSVRSQIRGGGKLIGGFVIEGPAYARVLLRAIGPSLAPFGITDALAEPVLTLRSNGKLVRRVDATTRLPEQGQAVAAAARVGAFALDSRAKDAAMLVVLPPGAYTVEVGGSGEGTVLLEIYDLP